ncbi:hypothetical protein DVT68_16975 [Dyella solisilvae]|uniref:Type II secretion system protein n=2 Tax=Dyella solisilvae TaxID=1920168 RepID=A0A370K4A2_9GAMM|nr:hypothetical protein DVT68_16975 [Dyella solisilvae]
MAAAVVAGMGVLGSPMHQRALQLDSRRVTDLSLISMQVNAYWSQHKSLPADLDAINLAHPMTSDPVTGTSFEYAATGSETYRLCAKFDAASESDGRSLGGNVLRWSHPAGRHCFDLGTKSGGPIGQPMS